MPVARRPTPTENRRVPTPSDDVVPFALTDGWPEPLAGCVVAFRETGIVPGSLPLSDEEWAALSSGGVQTLRVDDHPTMDGWTTQHPDGTETVTELEIPMTPVAAPPEALTSERAFSEWVLNVHGSLGRLLMWDPERTWWIAQEPDLELAITCAPRGMLTEDPEELSWFVLPGTEGGRREVENLRERYGVS